MEKRGPIYHLDMPAFSFGSLATQPTQAKIAAILERSFAVRASRNNPPSDSEVKERCDIARALFLVLLNEFGWSEPRIFDHMLEFVVRKLDGQDAIPPWVSEHRKSGTAMWAVNHRVPDGPDGSPRLVIPWTAAGEPFRPGGRSR